MNTTVTDESGQIVPSNSTLDSELVSAVKYNLPFGGPGLLLVTHDRIADASSLLKRYGSKESGDLIWLRRSELWQLSVPNPYAVHTFPLAYWIREEGEVTLGEDVRSEIPYLRYPQRLLATHIELSLFWIRTSLILSCLTSGNHARLNAGLKRERALLMQSALLARRIWKISAETIREVFIRTYPDNELGVLLSALDAAETRRAGDLGRTGDVLEQVWLHERFVQELSKQAR
ncbi:MAG TPA: hypothetical protein VHU83_08765 [Bryobacteraceae bacterium]|nr:hypothetical protein [Bryobacteraceae bacterium]